MGVMYDGHDFDEIGLTGDPQLSILASAPTYADASAVDGRPVTGMRFDGWTAAFTILVEGDAATRRQKLSTLGMWLDVDGPRKLVLPDTPERYYMAVPEGGIDLRRAIAAEYGQLVFTIVEPAAYGAEKSVTVPSGGSVSFVVGGTYPTRPTVTASAVRNSSSQVWGLRLDEGDFVHIATGSASARAIVLDNAARTLSVAGSAAIPTLDSDWLEFAPGPHTLRMDNGTGAATVKWIERWL
jgi:predicted phage tail component-like protein